MQGNTLWPEKPTIFPLDGGNTLAGGESQHTFVFVFVSVRDESQHTFVFVFVSVSACTK